MSTQNLYMDLIPALYTTIKYWKYSKHPATGEWVTNLWYNEIRAK